MVETERTLVKSPSELWETVNDLELIGQLSAELLGSRAIEVVESEPGRRLAWQVSGCPQAQVELALAQKGWGTHVSIRVDRHRGGEVFTGAVLECLLDELGSAQRRPFFALEQTSGSGEGPACGQNRTNGGTEDRVETPIVDASWIESPNARRQPKQAQEHADQAPRRIEGPRQQQTRASERVRERPPRGERRREPEPVRGQAKNALKQGHGNLDALADLITRRASERTMGAVQAAEHRLAAAGERLRLEADEAHRRARARITEAERGLSRKERQGEIMRARRERDSRIQAAEQQLASQAAEVFARLEREAGRLQERARRVAAAAAAKEVDRRVARSVAPALRSIEGKLTATLSLGRERSR